MTHSWWHDLVLGLVQGITEWLPVSSSGHLAVTDALFGATPSTWYDLLLHMGTLAAVLLVFRHRIACLFRAAFGPSSPDRTFAWGLVLGSLPIAVVGLLFQEEVEAAFGSLWAVGAAFLVTGGVLASTRRCRGHRRVTVKSALWVGLWQALALLPGISRSGMTIAGGLHAGLDRETAADFAFLLAVPALVGATLLKAVQVGEPLRITLPMAAGVGVSFTVGALTLRWLRGYVGRKGVHTFAPYCFAMAVVTIGLAWASR